jgi:hypothetical protein
MEMTAAIEATDAVTAFDVLDFASGKSYPPICSTNPPQI